jgi:hypothetical protein
MKITITNHNDQRQAPEVTIDTKGLTYPYAIRNALDLALELDGYDKSTIDEVFYRNVAVCQDKEEPAEERKWSFEELEQTLLEGGSVHLDQVGQYLFMHLIDHFEQALNNLNPFITPDFKVLKLKPEYIPLKKAKLSEEPSEEYLKAKNLDNKFCRGVIILLEEGSLYVDDTDTFDRLSKFFLDRNMSFKEMYREGGILRLQDQFKYLSPNKPAKNITWKGLFPSEFMLTLTSSQVAGVIRAILKGNHVRIDDDHTPRKIEEYFKNNSLVLQKDTAEHNSVVLHIPEKAFLKHVESCIKTYNEFGYIWTDMRWEIDYINNLINETAARIRKINGTDIKDENHEWIGTELRRKTKVK